MRVSVEVVSGPSAGKKISLRAGQIGQIGRTRWTDLCVPNDSFLSGMHFAVECGLDKCRLRDLNSAGGTTVNGTRVTEVLLRDGDEIVAGQTTFLVRMEGSSTSSPAVLTLSMPAREASSSTTTPRDLLPYLRNLPEPLFALLDAARDPRVLALVHGSQEEKQSLYEGEKGDELADFAPYLVRLAPQSRLLEELVYEGWGKSWGVYLTCQQPFRVVRKHFRHFLLVKTEDGRELYFRFYDPRVLRIFLPTCTSGETAEFFGPVSRFLLEGEEPSQLVEFTHRGNGAVAEQVAVTVTQPR